MRSLEGRLVRSEWHRGGGQGKSDDGRTWVWKDDGTARLVLEIEVPFDPKRPTDPPRAFKRPKIVVAWEE